MTILNKILIAFVGLLSLAMFAGGLGTIAVFYMDAKARSMISLDTQAAVMTTRAAIRAKDIPALEKEFTANLASEAVRQATQKKWAECLAELTQILKEIENLPRQEEKPPLADLLKYQAATQSLILGVQAGTITGAAQVETILAEYSKPINDMTLWTQKQSEAAHSRLQAFPEMMARVTRIVVIVCGSLVGFGTLVVIYLSLSIYNALRKPLRQTLALTSQVANGDLTVEFPTHKKDEFGRIWGALRGLVDRLRDTIGQVTSVSGRVSEVSQSVSDVTSQFSLNAQSQASTSEEISAAVEELVASIQTVANDAKEQVRTVETLTARLRDLSGRISETDSGFKSGRTLTTDLVMEAKQAQTAMEKLRVSMDGITSNSQRVSEIVEIISDISERINLLSLNASIEAARAGDAGRGFAVVASEISRLADQTAASIKSISDLTTENEREVQGGADSTAATASGLQRMQTGMASLERLIEELSKAVTAQVKANESVSESLGTLQISADAIRLASSEQSLSTDEIARSITDITEKSQNTAERAEELANTAGELRRLANVVTERLAFFKTGHTSG